MQRENSEFGRRGTKQASSRQNAPASKIPERPGSEIYRDGVREKPSETVVHIELHWPKYLAAAFACFAVYHVAFNRNADLFSIVFVGLIAGAIGYFVLSKFRMSLNSLHAIRTIGSRSPAFKIGALVGLGYFLYSTFFSPTEIMGLEWGEQTAFDDGFQRQDFGAVAILLLKAAGLMALGGIILDIVANRFFGASDETEVGGR